MIMQKRSMLMFILHIWHFVTVILMSYKWGMDFGVYMYMCRSNKNSIYV